MTSLVERLRLDGRVALVTGGGGHIGGAVADDLASLGAAVAVVDIDGAAAGAAVERLSGAGHAASAFVGDVADDGFTRGLPSEVAERHGGLDIVVNLASLVGTTSDLVGWNVPFEQQDVGTWRQAIDVGLTAAFTLVQSAAPLLAASGRGSVVNVASIYGVVGPDLRLYEGTGMGNPAAYAAAKGGLLQLTRWLSTTLAPDVRVNAVTPGGVWRGQDPQFLARYVSRTPLGRMASEDDVSGAVAFLCSDAAGYVTGHNLVVDGGWTAW